MNDVSKTLRMMVYASLFSALIASGSYLVIPIGPVPIALQSLYIYIIGLMFEWPWAVTSVSIFLLSGALGLPVFAGATSGIAKFVGPTGGYLVGYLPAVFLMAMCSTKGKRFWYMDVLAMIIGTTIIYFFGIIWLKQVLGCPLSKALMIGCYPFIPGDILKMITAFFISKALRNWMQETVDNPVLNED
ncbi:MAG: biotin transporter BioY [Desulfobacterales bacterium]|nr:biotin transporter BioY [Desulfobacterales bacterium]